MSKLYFRYGAMSSGKSTHLLQTAHNYEASGKTPFIIKPDIDKKSGTQISSRIGIARPIDMLVDKNMNIFNMFNGQNQKHYQTKGEPLACLLVDEAQFLTKEQIDQLLKVATFLKVPVICFGIRTDFMTHGFEGSDRLLQIAHTIEEMKTICAKCGTEKATLNARKIDNEYVFEGQQVAIDLNSDPNKKHKHNITYESLCASCYLKLSEGSLG